MQHDRFEISEAVIQAQSVTAPLSVRFLIDAIYESTVPFLQRDGQFLPKHPEIDVLLQLRNRIEEISDELQKVFAVLAQSCANERLGRWDSIGHAAEYYEEFSAIIEEETGIAPDWAADPAIQFERAKETFHAVTQLLTDIRCEMERTLWLQAEIDNLYVTVN